MTDHAEGASRAPAKLSVAALTICTLAFLACRIEPAGATSVYTYGKNEYRIVRDGLAPNKRFSIAAHGEEEDAEDDFHLYLMAEPAHRKIGPLEEIGPDLLDTGADAYRAAWSSDSLHVAVHYRVSRHIGALTLYRIERDRAYEVTVPSLFREVLKRGALENERQRATSIEAEWLDDTRLLLKEYSVFETVSPALAGATGRFGKFEGPETRNGETLYFVNFSAQAVCELAAGNTCQITRLTPGAFD
jgi:hypothetical protein